jgi:hypothetical protein
VDILHFKLPTVVFARTNDRETVTRTIL